MALSIQKQRNMANKTPKIIACLKRGYSIKSACEIANVGRATLYRWLNEAESEDASEEHKTLLRDYHEARGAGLEKLIKELDRWENESETTTVDYVDFQRDENGKVVVDEDGDPVGMLKSRKITTKRKKSRPTHFERAKFKLISQYPDEWGPRSVPEPEWRETKDNETTAVDLMEADDGV